MLIFLKFVRLPGEKSGSLPVPRDQPSQRPDCRVDRLAGLVHDVVQEPRPAALLVAHHLEHRAAACAKGTRHHKEGGRLHLGSEAPAAQPGLPALLQLVSGGHALGLMLAVVAVLALHHPDVVPPAALPRRLCQRAYHGEIGHRREFDGRVFPPGALGAHGAGGDHQIAPFHLELHAPAGTHPQKGVGPALIELLHGNGGRGAADPGGGDAHPHPVEGAGIGGEFPVLRRQDRGVKAGGDLFTAPRVAGQDDVPPHLAGAKLQMVEPVGRIGFGHRVPS